MKKIRTASLIATLLMTVYIGVAVNGGTIQASTILSQKSLMTSTLVVARDVTTDDNQGIVTNVIQSIKETLSNLAGTETDHAEPIVSVPDGQTKPTQSILLKTIRTNSCLGCCWPEICWQWLSTG